MMKMLMPLRLIIASVMMLISCAKDPVSSGPGTAPEITAISAEKRNFTVQSSNSPEIIFENTIVTITVKDEENDVIQILMTGDGIRDGGVSFGVSSSVNGWRKNGSNTDFQIPVPVYVNSAVVLKICFVAIDSKGNKSNSAEITFTVSN